MPFPQPPTTQMISGCFLPSPGSLDTYAARSPTLEGYCTRSKKPSGGSGIGSLSLFFSTSVVWKASCASAKLCSLGASFWALSSRDLAAGSIIVFTTEQDVVKHITAVSVTTRKLVFILLFITGFSFFFFMFDR